MSLIASFLKGRKLVFAALDVSVGPGLKQHLRDTRVSVAAGEKERSVTVMMKNIGVCERTLGQADDHRGGITLFRYCMDH